MPHTIRKMPIIHLAMLNANITKMPATIARTAIATLLMEKLLFAMTKDSFLPWNTSIVLIFISHVNNSRLLAHENPGKK